MIGFIVKIVIVVVVVLVGLNIFMPEKAMEAIEVISDTTGISEETITQNIDKATDIAIDGADMAKEKAQELKDEAIDKINE